MIGWDVMPSSRRAMLRRMSAAAGWVAAGLPSAARGAAPADDHPWLMPEDVPAISIDLPQLRYDGHWSPRPGAMRVLARELRLRTRLEPVAEPTTVEADDEDLFDTPFLYVAGDAELPKLGRGAESRLRQFLDLGGLAVFDAADGGTDLAFTRSVEELLGRISPGSELGPVARDHVLFRSFYLVDSPVGRTATVDHLLAIQEEGRIKALLVRNDLGGALAETADGRVAHPCVPGGAEQRQWAIRLGVNILLYATCTDYKADRAHVETLLRARRWR
jgi:hypothetical protein